MADKIIRVKQTVEITYQGHRSWVESTLSKYTLLPISTGPALTTDMSMPFPGAPGAVLHGNHRERYLIKQVISQTEEQPDPAIKADYTLAEQRGRQRRTEKVESFQQENPEDASDRD